MKITGLDLRETQKKTRRFLNDVADIDMNAGNDSLEVLVQKKEQMVRSATKLKAKLTPFRIMLLLMGITIIMSFLVWQNEQVREGLNKIEQHKQKRLTLEKSNEALRVEITRLSNYKRIESIATTKLRMAHPEKKPSVLFIPKGTYERFIQNNPNDLNQKTMSAK